MRTKWKAIVIISWHHDVRNGSGHSGISLTYTTELARTLDVK